MDPQAMPTYLFGDRIQLRARVRHDAAALKEVRAVFVAQGTALANPPRIELTGRPGEHPRRQEGPERVSTVSLFGRAERDRAMSGDYLLQEISATSRNNKHVTFASVPENVGFSPGGRTLPPRRRGGTLGVRRIGTPAPAPGQGKVSEANLNRGKDSRDGPNQPLPLCRNAA